MTEGEPQLVPELAVLDLTASLRFWRDLVGFDVSYTRIEEGFAYLVLGRAHLMLDQIGVGRTWRTGELDVPLGRGVNLQIGVPSLEEPLQRLAAARWSLFLEPEEKWYRTGKQEAGVVQFLVQDPDGYLLRLQSSIGTRTAPQD
jgi:catechol 2,3-dioxygenase-like lactoylglutathione lyase family enzyme